MAAPPIISGSFVPQAGQGHRIELVPERHDAVGIIEDDAQPEGVAGSFRYLAQGPEVGGFRFSGA